MVRILITWAGDATTHSGGYGNEDMLLAIRRHCPGFSWSFEVREAVDAERGEVGIARITGEIRLSAVPSSNTFCRDESRLAHLPCATHGSKEHQMLERNMRVETDISRALEISVHVGLLIAIATTCLVILRPFVPMILWGIIIAIAASPAYQKLRTVLHGRGAIAAIIFDVLLLAVLIVPVVLLTGSFIEGVQNVVARLKSGTPVIPPPPPRIETWPVVGVPIKSTWQLAYTNLSAALSSFAPQIRDMIPKVLLASAGIGLGVLQWIVSILIAGFLLRNEESAAKFAHSFAKRIFRDRGQELKELAASTIRSVTMGIIGVAIIQSICAAAGFVLGRLPAAGLWAALFLLAALLQIGTLVLIPAVIYMFAIATTTKATVFLVWCVIVGVMDNVLKPLLLGRGVPVPIAVVFLGAIGGFIMMGAIGLFVGSIVLSVAYKLFLAWLEESSQVRTEIREHSSSGRAAA